MAHLPQLIIDLALILGAAALIILLFKWMKQPLVLGYIIAGFLVGPYFAPLPTVAEAASITIWAEIGVIFLLFSLGLEFSFKKLIKVGGTASITAITEVVVMVAAGYGVGQLLGWSTMDSLFLGGILSISSTTIIIRAFEELGVKTSHFAVLVFGVLIVEDLVAIVLLVLLSTVAVSQQFAGTEMLYSILKLIFFLGIWFLMGIFLIPTFLRRTRKLLTDEMLLIISLAFCLMMVVLAYKAGFSPALGAFIMGSLLAETTKAEKIEHLVRPVKDLFGAIFFVSVGMMINPQVLLDYAGPIALLCGVTIFGKVFSTTLGALMSGQTLKTSIQAGFGLAQIGEFSFIIATLGVTLGVTSDFLYPIAVAVSAVTTLTTPYLIRASGPVSSWLQRMLPQKWVRRLSAYSTETRVVSHTSEWKVYMRDVIMNCALVSIVLIAIVLVSSKYLLPFFEEGVPTFWTRVGAATLALLMMLPFLWAMAVRNSSAVYGRIMAARSYTRLVGIVRVVRLGLAAVFIGFLLDRFFGFSVGIIATTVFIAVMIQFSGRIQHYYNRIEARFLNNFNQREIAESQRNRVELAPWDAHIIPVSIPPDAPSIGKTLEQLQWREKAGVNVVLIKRGDMQIPVPGKSEQVFPLDELLILGTDLQLKKIQALIRPQEKVEATTKTPHVTLHQYVIREGNPLIGKTIRESGLREQMGALVVGIERGQERLLNPDSSMVLVLADVVFVVGERKKLERFFT